MHRKLKSIVLMFLILVSFYACKSDQEKADTHIQKGNEYFAAEDYKSAELEFRNALQLKPESLKAWSALADTLFKLGKAKESFQAYAKVESLDTNNKDALIKLAGFYFLSKQTDKAAQKADAVLSMEPDNIEALLIKAQLLVQDQSFEEAETIYKKILDLDPNHSTAMKGLAQIKNFQKDYDATENLLVQSADVEPEDIKSRLTLVSYYINRKELGKAEEQLLKTAELNPKNAEVQMLLGNFYFRMNKESQAETAYLKAIELAPDAIKPYMALAGFYDITGREEKALNTYNKALEIQPENDTVKITLARFHYKNKNVDSAETLVEDILKARPKFYPARLLKSELLLNRMKFADALKILEDLSIEEPKDSRVHYFMALAQIGVGQNDRAKASVVKSVELNQGYDLAHLLLAEIYYQERSYDLALNEASIVVKKDPLSYKALLVASNARLRSGKIEEAEAGFRSLIKMDPENPVAYYRLGTLKSFQKKYDEAELNLNKALEKNPLLIDVFALLVRNSVVQKNFDAAHDLCVKQLAKVQDNPLLLGLIYNLRADVFLAQKDINSAKHYYNKAIESNPEFLKPYLSLATLYMAEKNKDKAIEQYKIMIEKQPKLPAPYMMLGTIYEMEKDYMKAETNYRKALELNPQFAAAANNLAYILADRTDKFDEALKFARIAKEKLPNDPRVMDTLGLVYYKKGLYGNAVNEYLDALEKAPDTPVILYHLGLAYHAKGEEPLAKESLTKALALDSRFPEAKEAKDLLGKMQQ